MEKRQRTAEVQDAGARCSRTGAGRSQGWLRVAGVDGVIDGYEAGLDDFGEDALAAIFHQVAQALADGVHFVAGRAGFVEMKDCGADHHSLADQFDEIEAEGFDVGAHCTGRNGFEAEGGGVFTYLFTLDQSDLTF